jgi:hypothetical protein
MYLNVLQLDIHHDDSNSVFDSSTLSMDNDIEGSEQTLSEETVATEQPSSPKLDNYAEVLPTTSTILKKKVDNLSKKPMGPYRRLQRKTE